MIEDWPCDLTTTTGEIVLIDPEDSDLAVYTWYYNTRDGSVHTFIENQGVYLSNLIGRRMGLSSDLEVDHSNRNGLDNRRTNLRSATRSQNAGNRNLQSNSTTGLKGVKFDKRNRNWVARIKVQRKEIHLGCFYSPKEAAMAYNLAAVKYFGEFAALNEV